MTLSIVYWVSFALLLFTKTADVLSTIRFAPAAAESNPWARRLFHRFGFKAGLLVISTAFLFVAIGQYLLVWWLCNPPMQALNAMLGTMIAWIQWDVARFNRTQKHSGITLLALRGYRSWARWWRHRGG